MPPVRPPTARAVPGSRAALRAGVSGGALVALAACGDTVAPPRVTAPDPGVPPATAGLVALHGAHVTGDPGVEASAPLVVALRDAAGRPAAGVPITWAVAGGGGLRVESARTDSAGTARAWWTLGDTAAAQTASAQVASASAPTGAPTRRVDFSGWVRQSPPIPPDRLIPLELPTVDGSGQVVHPDVVVLPRSWEGGAARLAMAITPYPYGDARQENPSLFVSGAGATWATPTGAQNPVVRPTGGYLSDPALAFDPSAHELRMYYREVVGPEDVIRLVTTPDGVRWSAPRETARVPSYGLVSPSVVRRSATHWLMWSVDGGAQGCADPQAHVDLRRSEDGVRWGAPTRVVLDQPGGSPWHVDVTWIGHLHEYWALYNLKPSGTCATPAVYLATSPDGVHWTTSRNPVLQRSAVAAFADIVYRSSFVYTPADDMVTFYFSGARWNGTHFVWSSAVERRSRAALFADLQRPAPQRARRGLPAPERLVGGARGAP